MSFLGFITARGGSKGIARKNLALLGGRPLIQYTVDAALASKNLERVFLSSDDPGIVEVCRALGLEVPYLRPAHLAADDSPVIDCVLHGLDWLAAEQGCTPGAVVLLQPTSPLRTGADIDAAVAAYQASGAESLVTVSAMVEHPFECIKRTKAGWSFLEKPAREAARRQDYGDAEFVFMNGAVYVTSTAFLRRERRFVLEGQTALHEVSQECGLDIDTPFDLALCEAWLAARAG